VNERLVIIPTYNERENIEKLIRRILNLKPDFNILIVDDNSPDGTGDVVQNLVNEFKEQLFLLRRPEKQGLGTAYIAGFKWALDQEMDADFSHDPNDLVRLYKSCQNGADLAIGSRYISGVNVVNWPIGRVLISYFASVYVRIITGMKIRDATAGFKCYRKEVLETIDHRKKRRDIKNVR